jgi:DNA invertase Pin-like site-specific DNA recombinase
MLDVVVCWKLDRFGRRLAHLINAIQALTDAGVGFTSIGEGIDTRSATERLMLGILGSFAASSARGCGSGSTRALRGRSGKVNASDDDHIG